MTGHSHGTGRGGFIEQTIRGLHGAMDRALYAEHSATGKGMLQRLDPRVKTAALPALILVSAMASKLWVVAALLLTATMLGAASGISLRFFATTLWLTTLPFSVALALPALFLTPGAAVYRIPFVEWTVTAQGVRTAAMLALRAETAATLTLVLVLTTLWTHVLKAMRMFRVPVVFVVILGMTCRYILLMLEAAHEMFESRKSRTVGPLSRGDQRRVAVLSTGALLGRTLQLSGDVHLAMQSRGFRGEVYILDDFRMTSRDWLASLAFGALAVALLWAGR